MTWTHDSAMPTPEDSELAEAQASNEPLDRLRRAVMAKLFDDPEGHLERIGRYQIKRAIGAGGMGTVYVAFDPELDREVAVKLLHYTRGETEGKRLLREAKGLARLSHPNVVQVHDAGTADDRVFLAMELVRGHDLRGWLRARPRHWREIVDVFTAAGRGLAAAHAAGLVHRDFKPENVLVGEDGTVKVADFGLVRTADMPAEVTVADSEDARLDAAVETLTRTGAAVGTPAYMAPEQHLALATDARTDQFSFCVALFEGIYGERPFRADSLRGLIEASRSDRLELPARPRVPKSLRRALRRGLRASPDDRFAHMEALVAALHPARRSGWRKLVLGVSAFGLAAGTMEGLFGLRGPVADDAAQCDAGEQVDHVWNDETKASMRAHLVSLDPKIGELAAGMATGAIDAYVASWAKAYASTCVADPEIDDSQQLARQQCLRSRLQEARGIVSVLGHADLALGSNVPQIVAALEPVDGCLRELTVARTVGEHVDELSFDLARARASWHAGQSREAYATAEALAQRARDAEALLIEADAWQLAAMIAKYDVIDKGDLTLTRRALANALEAAQAIGDPVRVLRCEVLLASAPEDDTFATARAGLDALASRVEASDDPQTRWVYHFGLSTPFLSSEKKFLDKHARQTLAIAERSFGPGHRFVELSRRVARTNAGRAALLANERGEPEVIEAVFGPGSPRVVEEMEKVALALEKEGKLDEARTQLDEAVAAWTKLEGLESTQVAATWRKIAHLERRRGNIEAALAAYDHAIESLAANPDVLSSTLLGRAEVLLDDGRADEALETIAHSDRIRRSGEDPRTGDFSRALLGRALLASGNAVGALAEYRAGRASFRKDDLGPATTLGMLDPFDIGEAEALLALDRPEQARDLAREVWARFRPRDNRHRHRRVLRARAGLVLAQALLAIDDADRESAEIIKTARLAMPEERRTRAEDRLDESLRRLGD